jgi:hypothetical protein
MKFDVEELMLQWRNGVEKFDVERLAAQRERLATLEQRHEEGLRLREEDIKERLNSAVQRLNGQVQPTALHFWFKHDSWTPHEGLIILCGFSPKNFKFDQEDIPYIPATEDVDRVGQIRSSYGGYGMTRLDHLRLDDTETRKLLYDEFFTIKLDFQSNYKILLKLWNSGGHTEISYTPAYFVEWAGRKKWKIDWYEWVVNNGYLPAPANTMLAVPLLAEKPLATNERNTLLIVIAALCKNYGFSHSGLGATTELGGMVTKLGRGISLDPKTVAKVLKQIPDALSSRGQ